MTSKDSARNGIITVHSDIDDWDEDVTSNTYQYNAQL
ncbi:hypothetical protein VII00023_03828 [Vibrio ichthyoenteri ATCC 700023]|uniref:Uncharacterized protein n=1 Tax=Vibrio ichthyoenteri ATCC 700023 TaxID=870968 RepID=F9S7M0_9VIBR|nr:hypothetical protein VII00023_03828 [Vibrio ichthyoenteri ATCC 700023]